MIRVSKLYFCCNLVLVSAKVHMLLIFKGKGQEVEINNLVHNFVVLTAMDMSRKLNFPNTVTIEASVLTDNLPE